MRRGAWGLRRLSPKQRGLIAAITVLIVAWLLAIAANGLAHYMGWGVDRMAPAALSAKLAPFYRVSTPEGAGPFPTALLFSGCDGPKDNLDRWAAALNADGWAAVIVDSHTPRGLGDHEIWRLICAGQIFMGSERAGDVLVSIDDVRRMPFVDPGRLALIGASHGGWAIMDLLALDPPSRLPFNLTGLPEDAPADPLAGVVGTVLLYPYCGPANRARPDGWRRPLPTLFLLAQDDMIASEESCISIAEAMRDRDQPVAWRVFDGVTHGFDQESRAPLSTLAFDEAATAAALSEGIAFLDAQGGG